MNRRGFLMGGLAALSVLGTGVHAASPWDRHLVTINQSLRAGTIHVNTNDRFLYLALGGRQALRYGVAVGAQGRAFKGTARVSRKALWPSWRPTANMIRVEPDVYGPFKAGLPGRHPQNPMGAAALYLARGGQETFYRIHGTHQPWTIGQSFSSGCIRLKNEDILDLHARVSPGAQVFVS